MRASENQSVLVKTYGYDGNIPLTEETWKCANCEKFSELDKPCNIDSSNKQTFPNKKLEPTDDCKYFCNKSKFTTTFNEDNMVGDNIIIPEQDDINIDKYIHGYGNLQDNIEKSIINGENYSINDSYPNMIEVKCEGNGKIYKATVELDPNWDPYMKELAIDKATTQLELKVKEDAQKILEDRLKKEQSNKKLTEEDKQQLRETREMIDNILGDTTSEQNTDTGQPTTNSAQEAMLDGDTKIGWFNQVTSWNRVINAARRTIGKTPISKEPSDSWKAKILLAEHSPIRLLEYDWGWEKLRQWVSVHLVRHHIGVEKFVHSQRGDRRELPCDRDHIYQGARNDMDMTANAQGLINMSRKRCCNCASKETREAWNLVLAELEKKDPILRSKCVRECVYRGFCPEWMSKCGYWKTDEFKIERANYVNTKYGKDVKYYYFNNIHCIVSNTGLVYAAPTSLYKNDDYLIDDNVDLTKTLMLKIKSQTVISGATKRAYISKETPDGNEAEYVDLLVMKAFGNNPQVNSMSTILHIDGNYMNNNIDNLVIAD